ncbi:MAG: carbohydrate ABC transporter permease [Opitutales bacterium]
MTAGERQRLKRGLAFISPWLIGFLAFSLYPLIASFAFSLTDYSVLAKPVWIGADNYSLMLEDAVFWKAVTNTLIFAALAIPMSLIMAFLLALLLNAGVPGTGLFRTLFFLPSLVPLVCLGLLWRWLLNGQVGLVNQGLQPILDAVNAVLGTGLQAPNWLVDPAYAKLGLVLAGVWGCGHAMVIFLAGLQDVPRQLYEAADIDGAGFWRKTWHITLPMVSPVIYFNGIMGLIGAFQVFAVPFVMTAGGDGPGRSLLFLATYIYQNAFEYWNMGYACAMGLVLFLLILGLTLLATRLLEKHVHYAGR